MFLRIEKTLTSLVLVDSNMRIVPEVLHFTNMLEQKGLSPNTIRSYLNDLKMFYLWLNQENLEFYEVKPKHIPSFIEFIDNKNVRGRVSPSTLSRYLATLGSFYRHFEAIGGYVEESPLVKVRGYRPLQSKGFLRHVTKNWDTSLQSYFKRKSKRKIDRKRLYPDDLMKCFEAIDLLWSEDQSLKFRNRLIFKLLYETGYRVSELLHLRIDDFDYPDPTEQTGNLYLIERVN